MELLKKRFFLSIALQGADFLQTLFFVFITGWFDEFNPLIRSITSLVILKIFALCAVTLFFISRSRLDVKLKGFMAINFVTFFAVMMNSFAIVFKVI